MTDLITKLEEASIKALSEVADQSMQVGELWGVQGRDPSPAYRSEMIEKIIAPRIAAILRASEQERGG